MKYQGQDLNKMYFQGMELKKLCFQGTVVYVYEEPGGGETYAIFNTLSEAQGLLPDTHFDWVWAKNENKWFRYNNIGRYEEYGVYSYSIEPLSITNNYIYWKDSTSASTNHYIDTNIPWTTGTTIYAKGRFFGYSTVAYLISDGQNGNTRWFYTGGNVYYDLRPNSRVSETHSMNADDMFEVAISNNKISINWNGEQIELSGGTQSFTAKYNVQLNTAGMKLESVKITDINADGETETKFDAVSYSGDTGIGLWDSVTNSLFTTTGLTYVSYYKGVTGYKGKLSIVDNKEYEWNGSSWKYLGEGIVEAENIYCSSMANGSAPAGDNYSAYYTFAPEVTPNTSTVMRVKAETCGYYNGGTIFGYRIWSAETVTSPLTIFRWFNTGSTAYYDWQTGSTGNARISQSSVSMAAGQELDITLKDYSMSGVIGTTVVNKSNTIKSYYLTSGYKNEYCFNLRNLKYKSVEITQDGEVKQRLVPKYDGSFYMYDEINDKKIDYLGTLYTLTGDTSFTGPKYYDVVTPITYREYATMDDFLADTTKYGTCLVTITSTDKVILYLYNGTYAEITASKTVEFETSASTAFTLTRTTGWPGTLLAQTSTALYFDQDVLLTPTSAFTGGVRFEKIKFNEGFLKLGGYAFRGRIVNHLYLPSTFSAATDYSVFYDGTINNLHIDNAEDYLNRVYCGNGDFTSPATYYNTAISVYDNDSTLIESISMRDGHTNIGNALMGYRKLKSVNVGKVSTISDSAFAQCLNITAFTSDASNTKYVASSDNKCLCYVNGSNKQWMFSAIDIDYIPEGITSFTKWSILNKKKLPDPFVLPNGITSLPGNPFAGTNIKTLDLRNTQITSIAPLSHTYQSSITTLYLPSTITSLGNGAFWTYTAVTVEDASKITGTINGTGYGNFFRDCGGLKTLRMPNLKISCNISLATGLDEAALVVFLGDLFDHTTAGTGSSPKLTLGSTNLAKLTEEEIAIATSKGWTVA